VSLVEAERGSTSPELTDRVAWVREWALIDLRIQQADWRGWTARDALRLERIGALRRDRPLAHSARLGQRQCGRPAGGPARARPAADRWGSVLPRAPTR
jgi:hypothetical protein